MIYVMVSSAESVQIDAAMADEISIQYDISSLDEALYQRAWEGDFKKSIGSTYAANQEYLLPTLVTDSEASSSFGISEISDSDKVEWDIDAIESEMDDFMDAAVDTSERGVTPDIFPKCGEYLLRTPRVTIDVTSQLSVTPKDLILAKNYGTTVLVLFALDRARKTTSISLRGQVSVLSSCYALRKKLERAHLYPLWIKTAVLGRPQSRYLGHLPPTGRFVWAKRSFRPREKA
jgi:hypothetical protein